MFGTWAFSTAFTIFQALRPIHGQRLLAQNHFPALAAAIAISAWELFGVHISIASMSFRAMSLCQSVSTDS